MKQVKQKGVFPLHLVIIGMMMAMLTMVFMPSCADEQFNIKPTVSDQDTIGVIKEYYYLTERTMLVTASKTDELQKSTAKFQLNSAWVNEQYSFSYKFQPDLYCRIELSKPLIEVLSSEDLPTDMTKSRIISRTPYHEGTTFGEDVVQEYTFADSQTATAYYGWRYQGVIVNGDTLASPHVVITDLVYQNNKITSDGTKTETEDPYRMTLYFNATYATRAVSGSEMSNSIELCPWYKKVVTSEATKVLKVVYDGNYVGNPYNAYELTETVTTNKSTFSNNYKVPLEHKIVGPLEREQPTLDSLFTDKSTGKKQEEIFSTIKDTSGFTVKTMSGTYSSTATGKKHKTVVDNLITYTYQVPVKFESEYGTYNIPSISLSFSENGFDVTKQETTEDYTLFKSINHVSAKLADCTPQTVDEIVRLKMAKEKPQTVTAIDSVYTKKGQIDEYIIEKTITYSDGSKSTSTYSYEGRHSLKPIAFGEVITSSLAWNAPSISRGQKTTSTEEKKFSSLTKFSAVYTTTQLQSIATNNVEQGTFAFEETIPIVTFIDGNTKIEFDARSYSLTDKGATLSTTPQTIVKNGISYNSYAYDYTLLATFTGSSSETLVSNGKLLIKADVVGEPTYTPSQTWSNNTTTLTITKTTPHSAGNDEIEKFSQNFTISLSQLTEDKIYANNTSFTTTMSKSPSESKTTDGKWEITTVTTNITLKTTNGEVTRTQNAQSKGGIVVFKDNNYTHTFDIQLTPSASETLGSSITEGQYVVTPHNLTLKASTPDGKELSTVGVTNIYVKKEASPSSHQEKTIIYSDGTVDAEIIITYDDGTTETLKASDAFGKRFAFNFTNANAVTKVVDNTNFTATGQVGTRSATSSTKNSWKVTEYSYPYNITFNNGVNADNFTTSYKYNNYHFEYTHPTFGTISLSDPTVSMEHKSLNITTNGSDNEYDVYNAKEIVTGTASATEGNYTKDLTVTHTLKMIKTPSGPNYGKPQGFTVTATYDPTSKVTRRAFVFNWEQGVTYAVCDYDKSLPTASDFMYKTDTYSEYNSVGYDKDNSNHWQPAKGVDATDAIRWYKKDGTLMSAIDKALTCKAIGWRNIVNGNYALIIPGYTYTINGYYITVTAPNGEQVIFSSEY